MEALHTRTGVKANCLGKYRLLAGLGHGGMAAVHLAVVHGPSGFNKLVVIKQIHAQYAEDPEVLGMFLDEARLAARLSHPNVVQTNEVGQEGEHHFLAMEYLDGQPLSRINQRLGRQGGLPLVMHLRVIADLLGGLHYAHELTDYDGTPLGVVHRDVSPHNIFVTYDGVVKVVDFGIAKARDALTQTRVGIIKGKIAYMAPEQARSSHVDRRADVFAVGVMLWEAATGTRPWKGVSELVILKSLLAGRFPTPQSVKPDVPEPLEAIILKALARNPRDRYATAAELQDALEAYLGTTGEHYQQRELGKLISAHFEVERARIKAVIDEQLGVPPEAVLALPVIDHATTTSEDPDRAKDSSPSIRIEPLNQASQSTPTSSAFVDVITHRTRPPPPPRRGLVVWAGALLAGAVTSAAIGFSLHRTPPPAEAAPSPAAPVAAAPAASSTVELRLSASPSETRIFLDDAPLMGNPFKGDFPRDAAPHRLRIEAPGFITRIESVTLATNLVFDIVLAREPAALAAPAVVRGPLPTSPHSKQRYLDSTNPYAPR